jgi:hypothetical protein
MKPVPNRASKRVTKLDPTAARLKAERAALNESSGKFKTGTQGNPALSVPELVEPLKTVLSERT